ncbi:MAG: hypothetical protein WD795_16355 [Woeseia sp.]
MTTVKFTPPAVPSLDVSPSLRAWLDEQMRRLQVLVNEAIQPEDVSSLSIAGEQIDSGTIADARLALDTSLVFTGPFPTAQFQTTGTVEFQFFVTDAAADEGRWGFHANSLGDFNLRTRTDAGGIGTDAVKVQRGIGTAVAEVELNALVLDFNGQIQAQDGLVSAPAIVGSDVDTGIFFTANNTRFASGGTEMFAVAAIGPIVRAGGALYIAERAAANTDVAGHGQLWVKNTTPCELWFTDDAGNDTQIV